MSFHGIQRCCLSTSTPRGGDRQTYFRTNAGPVARINPSPSLVWSKALDVNGVVWRTPDRSLTFFDRGVYSLGLLACVAESRLTAATGCPLRKGTHYEEIYSLGRQDRLVHLTISPQARAKWPGLPATLEARLMRRKVKCKEVRVIDPLRFPNADIMDFYSYRWEIELGYREMKQSLLGSRLTLRSRRPDMVRQELWGTLLAYNLICFQMARMAYSLDSILPNQLSFHHAAYFLTKELSMLPAVSPGRLPEVMRSMLEMAPSFLLPDRRERSYPCAVRARLQKYAVRKSLSGLK